MINKAGERMKHLKGFTKAESKNLQCLLKFEAHDYVLDKVWEVQIIESDIPNKYKENHHVYFTLIDSDGVTDNPYYQFGYYASTLLESPNREAGICLHHGGAYEENVEISAGAFSEAVNKVEKHLKEKENV